MIIAKDTPSNRFSFTVRYFLAGFMSCIMRGYTLVHKHVYRFYSAVLGLQFACMCNPNLAYAFLTCTRASCTRLVRTQELCTVGLKSSTLRAHEGLHVCEIKNVSCRALAARVFCQV